MYDTAFVRRDNVNDIPDICARNSELRVIFITEDGCRYSLFNAKYWTERTLRLISELVNNLVSDEE